MAKLKLDKESLQGFFFNHTEKIVLAVVLLLLGLFIWSGSGLEGIGAQSPKLLVTKVDAAASNLKRDSWETIKEEYPLALDHVKRKQVGDAVMGDTYYRLDIPLSPPSTSPNTPRLDPKIFPVTDLEATVVVGALAFKATPARKDWADPFADLENMEQKKIEAPKKRPKKKKKSGGLGMYGEGMESMMPGTGEESDSESMYASGMAGMYGQMEAGGGSATPAVRADASKFDGYRPAVTSTPTGSSVLARSFPTVAVKALVPYQQQWDEFERVFVDAAGYQPARDIPRYLSFRAERAEVPSDPSAPLTWTLITTTDHALAMIPKLEFAGYPGEIADSKYLLPGILTMPVPPVMMRDLRGLALHSKVPIQEEKKVVAPERTSAAVADISELGSAPDPDALPAAGTRPPGASGSAMYGGMPGGSTGGMEMYAGGEGTGGYGGGMGGYGGGMSPQVARGPQAEFLMVRFFDHFVKPGVKYVYRIQVTVEDPNHPQNPQLQPIDRNLADTTRERLAKVIADEAKQTAALKTPVRTYMVASEWSEPSAPISVSLPSEAYAGGVTLPRMLDILRGAEPNLGQKSGYSVPDGEPMANVMNLSWSPKYAADIPGIVMAARGAYLNKSVPVDVIDPITLIYKRIPDYPLASGELLVDLRGGDVLEAPVGTAAPLLTPGEIAVIDAAGNLVVRNELDDWQVFEKYAPPPPIVVDAPSTGESSDAMSAEFESLYSP